MKKIIMLMLFLIICPLTVIGETDDQNFTIINEVNKFYKTTTIYNNTETIAIESANILSYSEEITEEEYNMLASETYPNSSSSTTIETTYKKMTATLSSNGSYYRYKVVLNWKKMPSVRSYDVIAIGYYSSVTPYSSVVFSQKYCTSSSSCVTTNSYSYKKNTTTGTGIVFKLPTGSFTNLTQTLYFDVQKNTTSTIVSQKLVGDYAHATSTSTINIASTFKINTTGISFSSYTNYYDSITPAVVTWSGTW